MRISECVVFGNPASCVSCSIDSVCVSRSIFHMITILILITNCVVIIIKFLEHKKDSEVNSHNLFVGLLAVSDLMYGIYMSIISINDLYIGNDLAFSAMNWKTSMTCVNTSIY